MTITEAELDGRRVASPDGEVKHCPTCGAELLEGSRFCSQCGHALAALFAPEPDDLLTIVFIDLEGFSRFAARKSVDDVRNVIRVFNWLVREQVTRHGGFEVKQLGDGFMLAFSSPAKAVACAAGILRVTAPGGDGTGLPPSVRACAGINSGDAIREGADFFGHTVNVASRIVGRAAGGELWLSEGTRVLAGHVDGVRFEEVGLRKLRGIEGRQRLYRAVWE